MPVKVKATVSGAKQLARRIKTIQEGLPTLVSRQELGAFLVRRMQRRFDERVGPDGKAWAARSPASQGNHPLLQKTGTMRKNIAVLGGVGGTGMGINTGAGFRIGVRDFKFVETLAVGSRVRNTADIARVHNRGNKTTPRRTFVGIGRLDVKAVDSLLRRKSQKLVNHGR